MAQTEKYDTMRHTIGDITVAFDACPDEYAGVVVVLRHQAEWVLVKNRHRGWEFPGGRREPGEGWAETARREALEEAGARLRDLRYAGWYARPDGRVTVIAAAEVEAFAALTGRFETVEIGLFSRLPPGLSFERGLYDLLTASSMVRAGGGSAMASVSITPLTAADRDWVRRFIVRHWGDEIIVVHETVYRPHELPGFAAIEGGEPVGLLTYHLADDGCEAVSLDSERPGRGVGTALLAAVEGAARRAGCRRLWLVTTNDNLHALRFYQRRGFLLVAVHRGAVERARRLKPTIPLVGNDGIPLRDELELELPLDGEPESVVPVLGQQRHQTRGNPA